MNYRIYEGTKEIKNYIKEIKSTINLIEIDKFAQYSQLRNKAYYEESNLINITYTYTYLCLSTIQRI